MGGSWGGDSADEHEWQVEVAISDELRGRLLSYRMAAELQQRLSTILHRFEGALNFYNYTRHKRIKNREDKAPQTTTTTTPSSSTAPAIPPADGHDGVQTDRLAAPAAAAAPPTRSSRPRLPPHVDFNADRNVRVMRDVSIESTVGDEGSGLQLLVLRLHGESFMLNQIRKMVAMAALLARGLVSDAVFSRSFKQGGVYIPTAPSLGLYLDRCPLHAVRQQVQAEEGGGAPARCTAPQGGRRRRPSAARNSRSTQSRHQPRPTRRREGKRRTRSACVWRRCTSSTKQPFRVSSTCTQRIPRTIRRSSSASPATRLSASDPLPFPLLLLVRVVVVSTEFRRQHILPGICRAEAEELRAYRWLAGPGLPPFAVERGHRAAAATAAAAAAGLTSAQQPLRPRQEGETRVAMSAV